MWTCSGGGRLRPQEREVPSESASAGQERMLDPYRERQDADLQQRWISEGTRTAKQDKHVHLKMATIEGQDIQARMAEAFAGAVDKAKETPKEAWDDAGATDHNAEDEEPSVPSQLEAMERTNVRVQSTTEHFTPRARKRAQLVADLHVSLEHACDAVLGAALDRAMHELKAR